MSDTPIIDKIAAAQVAWLDVEAKEEGTGKLTIMEACDCYYDVELTKEEYIQLGKEILAEAEKL